MGDAGRSENGGINEGCRALSKCSPATKKRRKNLVATKKSRRDEKNSSRRKNLGVRRFLGMSVGAFNVNYIKYLRSLICFNN